MVASKEVVDLAVIQLVIIFRVKKAGQIRSHRARKISKGIGNGNQAPLIISQKRFQAGIFRGGINGDRIGICGTSLRGSPGWGPTT
jgi:hypothetical protein